MVIAGNCPWWLIDSGWIGVVVHLAKAESGTSPPVVGERRKILSSVAGSPCSDGRTSMIT